MLPGKSCDSITVFTALICNKINFYYKIKQYVLILGHDLYMGLGFSYLRPVFLSLITCLFCVCFRCSAQSVPMGCTCAYCMYIESRPDWKCELTPGGNNINKILHLLDSINGGV